MTELAGRVLGSVLVNVILGIVMVIPVLLWSFPVAYEMGDPEHGPESWLWGIVPTLVYAAVVALANWAVMRGGDRRQQRAQGAVAAVVLVGCLVAAVIFLYSGLVPR